MNTFNSLPDTSAYHIGFCVTCGLPFVDAVGAPGRWLCEVRDYLGTEDYKRLCAEIGADADAPVNLFGHEIQPIASDAPLNPITETDVNAYHRIVDNLLYRVFGTFNKEKRGDLTFVWSGQTDAERICDCQSTLPRLAEHIETENGLDGWMDVTLEDYQRRQNDIAELSLILSRKQNK